MSCEKLRSQLQRQLAEMKERGVAKGRERVVSGYVPGGDGRGPRMLLADYPGRTFLCMNSNGYLGLNRHPDVIAAAARAAERFGAGPGAVRFISGTSQVHVELEQALADFHDREAAMLFSAAYAAMIGVLPALVDETTLVVSDELNHNCIIRALRLAKVGEKAVYPHLDLAALEKILVAGKGRYQRVCVVSDGVFSMRGDHAPLRRIADICRQHEADYEQGIITLIDDSHGVGAFGAGGRGSEEVEGARADILVATLGKAFGVNGGYVVAERAVVDYLRETAVSYIYSNPISPAEAAAAHAALTVVSGEEGLQLLAKLRRLTRRLREGVARAGFETLEGEHPIVPVLIRDSAKTSALVEHLFAHDILATGLNYPVVARGEQEIRLQVSAAHGDNDIDDVLDALQSFSASGAEA